MGPYFKIQSIGAINDDSGEAGHRFRQESGQDSVRKPARYRSEATLAL
jgi:hypothetical protein